MAQNTETYHESLESRAPAVGVLLDKLRKSSVYHSIETKSRTLTENDISTLLDEEKIRWAWLRKEMLESIELNRVKKKGQVASQHRKASHKEVWEAPADHVEDEASWYSSS